MRDALPDFSTPILRALNRWRNGLDEPASAEEFAAAVNEADTVIARIDYR